MLLFVVRALDMAGKVQDTENWNKMLEGWCLKMGVLLFLWNEGTEQTETSQGTSVPKTRVMMIDLL